MATKKLAKELGLVRKSRRAVHGTAQTYDRNRQFFSYLIVIDFESTCWKERNSYAQEIIEFPAVLLNTANGKIESEFHTYVQPQEHPTLSDFCTELTGISQTQVETGVPLQVCLSLFARWLLALQQEKNFVFLKEENCALPVNPCAFVTWSDWDLGACLEYECKRKQISKPEMLNRWIDLRATYKIFYNRKPKGLNGALQDLGIVFSGREHSGLDDARNTARLAWRMLTDGCVMKLTKSLDRAPLKTKPMLQNAPKNTIGDRSKKFEFDLPVAKSTFKQCGSGGKENGTILEVNSNTAVCQSLVAPKTLLCGMISLGVQIQKCESLGRFSFARAPVSVSSLSDTNTSLLVSTTVDGTDAAQPVAAADSTVLSSEWDEHLFYSVEESCSYDDVILEDDKSDSVCAEMTEAVLDNTQCVIPKVSLSSECASSSESNRILFKNSNTTVYSVEKPRSLSVSSAFKIPMSASKIRTDASISHPSTSLRNPKVLFGLERSGKASELDTTTHEISCTSAVDDLCVFSKSRLSSASLVTAPKSAASSLMNGASLSHFRTVGKPSRNGTSPLCGCGRRARRLTVANGGPNHGRAFYSCPIGRNATGNKKNCGFFKWESAHLKGSSASLSFNGTSHLSLSETFSHSFKKFRGTSLRH